MVVREVISYKEGKNRRINHDMMIGYGDLVKDVGAYHFVCGI